MQIEEGKYYKARNGQMIGPIRHREDDNDSWPFRANGGKHGTLYYKESGRCNEGMSDYGQEQYDLISERTPQVIVAEIDALMAELKEHYR